MKYFICLSVTIVLISFATVCYSVKKVATTKSPVLSAIADREPDIFEESEYDDEGLENSDILGDVQGWVNPHNMFSYNTKKRKNVPSGDIKAQNTVDTVSNPTIHIVKKVTASRNKQGKSRLSKTVEEQETVVVQEPCPPPQIVPCECNCKELRDENERCAESLKGLRMRAMLSHQHDGNEECNEREFIYLRRLALNLVNKARYFKKINSNVKVEIFVTPEDIDQIEKYANSCKYSSNLEITLSELFSTSIVIPEGQESSYWIIDFWEKLKREASAMWAVPCLALLGVMLFISIRRSTWGQKFVVSMVYLFFASFIWHWVHLYKVNEAKQLAFLSSRAIPASCSPQEMTWFEAAKSWVRAFGQGKDECEQYYSMMHVDTIWRVSPSMVLSETLSVCLFHPLSVLGGYLGVFISDYYSKMSLLEMIPATFFLAFFVLLVFTFIFRYTLVLPFWMGRLESQQPKPQREYYKDRIEDLNEQAGYIPLRKPSVAKPTKVKEPIEEKVEEETNFVHSETVPEEMTYIPTESEDEFMFVPEDEVIVDESDSKHEGT